MLSTTTKVLVVGHGFVGGRLAALLTREGHTVTALRRRPAPVAAGAQGLVADIARIETLAGLPKVAFLVFVAAPGQGGGEEAYRKLYLQGTKNLQQALPGSPRWLFVSSTSVYGQSDGTWVDEDAPT